MHLFCCVFVSSLVLIQAQFPEYPPQYSENPLQQPIFNPLQHPFSPYAFRPINYQHLRPHPPPRFGPFDNVYNDKGEQLACHMVCSVKNTNNDMDELDVEDAPGLRNNKESNENKIEKKED